jgi:predicted aconitase with swiveling domain
MVAEEIETVLCGKGSGGLQQLLAAQNKIELSFVGGVDHQTGQKLQP